MRIRIGAIADDYTGAADLANTWRRNGMRVFQTIGIPEGAMPDIKADAIVVALKIRSLEPKIALETALGAQDWLNSLGATHIIYKICSTFDSTDKGNIGPVTQALMAKAGAKWALVTPAFPETKRTVYQGHLFVAEKLLSESSLQYHPLNPMNEANLVRVLSRQSELKVGLLDLITLRAGAAAIKARLNEMAQNGQALIVADAICEDDLEILGKLAIASPISCGASGLGLGLARALRALRAQKGQIGNNNSSQNKKPPRKSDARSAILVGSCSAKTLEQVEVAERKMALFHLDAERLIVSGGDISAAIDWFTSHIEAGPILISAAGKPESVAAIQARHGRLESAQIIENAMAKLAASLVEQGVDQLIVAGGETAGAVVDRLGIELLEVGKELAPGVPVLKTVGRAAGDITLVLKSGNFGAADFFSDALERM